MWFQYVIGYDKQEQHSLVTSLRKELMDFQDSISRVDRCARCAVLFYETDLDRRGVADFSGSWFFF